ncbi:MAG TPA: hypothetical protein VMC85_00375 [Desulfomonilaceae bacterium]|nr:hypothetical protein [Desulfomonilaceae bacterium]
MGWPIGIRLAALYSPLFLIFGYTGKWDYFFGGVLFGLCFIPTYYQMISRLLDSVTKMERVESVFQRKKTEWSVGKVLLGILGGVSFVVITMFVMIEGPSLVGDGTLGKFVGFLPLVVVWLLVDGSIFVGLWRTSPKRS